MEYESLNYRQMIQLISSCRVCRLSVTADGQPYVIPMCFSCRFDGCVPIFTLTAYNDGKTMDYLARNPTVMLEFERSSLGGATETVLVSGYAVVEEERRRAKKRDEDFFTPAGRRGRGEDFYGDAGRADRRDFGRGDFDRDDFGRSDFERGNFRRDDFGRSDFDRSDFRCPEDLYREDRARAGLDRDDRSAGYPRTDAFRRAESCRGPRFDSMPHPCKTFTITVETSEMTGRRYDGCTSRCRNSEVGEF